MTSPPAHLHRIHPSPHRREGGGLSYVIHGKDAIGFSVVLLSDAAKPESVKGIRNINTQKEELLYDMAGTT